jgi:hypothetical protein
MDFEFITDDDQRTQAIEAYNSSIAEINDQHKLVLDEEVSGLKSKNAELLDEKKKADAKLKEFDNYDFDAANEAMAFLENNKDAKLIKDGKVDELIEKKTSALQSDHEAVVGELNSKLKEVVAHGEKYETLYRTKMVEDALREAAVGAKVRPEAITDVLLHGRNIFSLADDGSVEARGKDGKLLKTDDDKVLTTSNWIDSLKRTSPHYWPGSKGAGAEGGGEGGGDDLTAAIQRAAAAGNHAEYRRLRKKQQKG